MMLLGSVLGGERWHSMKYSKRANVVVYILEIAITTALLITTMLNGHSLFFDSQPAITEEQLKPLQLCLVILCALYIFELIYRPITNIPLALHHIITLVMCAVMMKSLIDHSVVVVSLSIENGHPVVSHALKMTSPMLNLMRVTIILSLHAITEQPTFLGKEGQGCTQRA